MTNTGSGTVKTDAEETRAAVLRPYNGKKEGNGNWATAGASLLVGAAFFALWFWLLPGWLGFHVASTGAGRWRWIAAVPSVLGRSEEHTSELQSRRDLVCRLLLEKKKNAAMTGPAIRR